MSQQESKYLTRFCYAMAEKGGYRKEIAKKSIIEMIKVVFDKNGLLFPDAPKKKSYRIAIKAIEDGVFNEEKPKIDFYRTNGWLYIRKEILGLYGKTCMKCGKYTENAHVDHIKPRSKHPELELCALNLQILCFSCNKEKSNHYDTDYRTKLPRTEWANLVSICARKKNE